MRSANLPAALGCLVVLNACGGGGGGAATPTSPVTTTPSPSATPSTAPSISDDASLFRLVTQTEPFAAYAPFPNAEEFTTGRLVGSECGLCGLSSAGTRAPE